MAPRELQVGVVASRLTGQTRTAIFLRAAGFVLAGLAVLLNPPSHLELILGLAAAYLAVAGLVGILGGRFEILVWVGPLMDTAAVTAFTWFLAASQEGIWVLFAFPLAGAATVSRLLALGVGALALLAVNLELMFGPFAASIWSPWPSAALVGLTLCTLAVQRGWEAEREVRRGLQRLAEATRPLPAGRSLEEAVTELASRARGLARASAVGFWYLERGRARSGPMIGGPADVTPPLDQAPDELLALSDRPSWPLSALHVSGWSDRFGEGLSLRRDDQALGLIAISWEQARFSISNSRASLRAFARWASQALAQVQSEELQAETLRREQVVAAAATRLGAAQDSEAVEDIRVETLLTLGMNLHSSHDFDAAELAGRIQTMVDSALARCLAHAAAVDAESRLRESIEAMPAPFVVRDPSGGVFISNAAYRALNLGDADWPANPAGSWEAQSGDGDRVFVVATLPVEGRTYQASVFREVTDERQALRAKDQLIALVGHELRNPLAAVRGYNDLMGRHLKVVEENLGQLNRLIGDLIESSRLGTSQLPMKNQIVDLDPLAREASQRFYGRTNEALHLDLGEPPPVVGDPDRLAEVLDNLLVNAEKYSTDASDILLRTLVQGDDVLVAIVDHGRGISEDQLPHIFEPFYRVEPSTGATQPQGWGLGLSIVRDLVAAHRGRVWAESKGSGLGSTFWIALPRVVVETEDSTESVA
jgi:signal transduction histidine kinase